MKINFARISMIEAMEANTEILTTEQRNAVRWLGREYFRASNRASSFDEMDTFNARGCYYSRIADESAEHRSIRRQRGRIGWTAERWNMAEAEEAI